MIITATQKQISVTPRKMRMMAVAVKNLKPQEAVEQLGHLNYSAAKPLRKVFQQAIANATNNHKLSPDTLKIKEIVVGQGWTLKRWRAGARGRGKPYTRRRSHVTVKLESIQPVAKATSAKSKPKAKTTTKAAKPTTKTKKSTNKKTK